MFLEISFRVFTALGIRCRWRFAGQHTATMQARAFTGTLNTKLQRSIKRAEHQAHAMACSSAKVQYRPVSFAATNAAASQHSTTHGSFRSSSSPPKPPRALVRTHAQAEKRVVRITVAGPPTAPPRVIEVDDPQVVPADVLSFNQIQHELQARQASVGKAEAREQAAIIQAQRQEISSLRQALAETQDVMLKGKQTYNQVVHTKDLQIAQLYELAASGVRERAKLRQEVNEVQQELQGTRRQLHSFMASLMQLKNSMASAGEGDLEHALELLQASSYSQSLNGAGQLGGTNLTEDEVMDQLQQMQQLSETLVQDMRQDEQLLSQGPASRSSSESTWDFDSLDSADIYNSSSSSGVKSAAAAASSSSSSGLPDLQLLTLQPRCHIQQGPYNTPSSSSSRCGASGAPVATAASRRRHCCRPLLPLWRLLGGHAGFRAHVAHRALAADVQQLLWGQVGAARRPQPAFESGTTWVLIVQQQLHDSWHHTYDRAT